VVVRRAILFLRRRESGRLAREQLRLLGEAFDRSFQESWDREHDDYVVRQLLQLIRPEFTATTWTAFEALVIQERRPAEVARELGCSINSVVLSKFRVLKRLREIGRGLVEC
jgi:hypothetical protein